MKTLNTLVALAFVLTISLPGSDAAAAGTVPQTVFSAVRMAASQTPDELSSSRRGRRNTAIALGVAAGLLGAAAISAGAYPSYPYPYHPYRYHGYYGPYYPYYGPPFVYVRPRKIRCWIYDPYRGIHYRGYCYR